MKFELYDNKINYSVIVEYNVAKASLGNFIRLVNNDASAKRVLKGILSRKEWGKIKRLKLPRESYENVIEQITKHEIFPRLDELSTLSVKFNKKYLEISELYARDKGKYNSLLEEYLD